ncbi:MAG TPA: nuclear transport factor 2 family protein [Myxococcota bacterium]|jgi:hypothetical protein
MIEIHDELAIRELNARYIDAVNRVDADAWQATWAENCVWNLLGTEVRGRAAVAKLWQGAMAQFEFALMTLNSGMLEKQGGVVSGRWYVTEYLRPASGGGRFVLGVYRDRYVKELGAWKFEQRVYHALYQGACDLSGAYLRAPT